MRLANGSVIYISWHDAISSIVFSLTSYKLQFFTLGPHKLVNVIKFFRPSVLIELSGKKSAFNEEVVRAMTSVCKKPIIFALSTPEEECTAKDVFFWSKGKVIYTSQVHQHPFLFYKRRIVLRCAYISYIFPGLALGVMLSGARYIHEDMLLAAANALASQVMHEDIVRGVLYPNFRETRTISAHIAAVVAKKAYQLGLASTLPEPENLIEVAKSSMYKHP